jgi:hypothetical protein
MHMRVSVSPSEMCSLSVYGPSLVMTPAATRIEMARDCQNEKNRIPLTQRNFGIGLKGCQIRRKSGRRELRTEMTLIRC